MKKDKVVVHISLPVSKKVMKKIASSDTAGAEMVEVLEAWAENEPAAAAKKGKEAEKGDVYFACVRHKNQRITQLQCLSRQAKKTFGCASCKAGRLIRNISKLQEDLNKELKR